MSWGPRRVHRCLSASQRKVASGMVDLAREACRWTMASVGLLSVHRNVDRPATGRSDRSSIMHSAMKYSRLRRKSLRASRFFGVVPRTHSPGAAPGFLRPVLLPPRTLIVRLRDPSRFLMVPRTNRFVVDVVSNTNVPSHHQLKGNHTIVPVASKKKRHLRKGLLCI